MRLSAPVASAAVLVTARNCEAVLGLTWPEVAAFVAARGLAVGRVGRRPFIVLADIVEALDGVRARAWTDDDTAAEIEASRAGGSR